MNDEERAKHKPIGPYAPPRPSEVEDSRPEPMAVANDKATIHSDSHLPTSAPMDAYSEEVARRYAQVPEKARTAAREENRAQEDPAGYTPEDARGYKRLDEEQE